MQGSLFLCVKRSYNLIIPLLFQWNIVYYYSLLKTLDYHLNFTSISFYVEIE
ncbi:hypothetical protein Lalb_Chr05g0224411 [Lupinus albus]|uniref:Uncharacterized protein n=1 Tax=Lupinus albus TaxID=3870 RepID=A0A6A4QJJ0_LUPAL|nr:hypothetical protein Lalb_Chr05g0224411 [Lupinus albus]